MKNKARKYSDAEVVLLVDTLMAKWKNLRKQRKLTLQDVADRMGVTRQFVQSLETRRFSMTSLPTLKRLAAAIDMRLEVKLVKYK